MAKHSQNVIFTTLLRVKSLSLLGCYQFYFYAEDILRLDILYFNILPTVFSKLAEAHEKLPT